VQNGAIHHDSVIIEIPHESCGLEVEYLEGAVLTCRKEPFIVLLEA
jgi:hypothetical protein